VWCVFTIIQEINMKVKVKVFVHAGKTWRYDPTTTETVESVKYELFPFDMSHTSMDAVLVGEQEIEIEVPDSYDPRPAMVKKLEREKENVKAAFAKRITEIDSQIRNLLAIESNAEAV
jgi:hypothetical protein